MTELAALDTEGAFRLWLRNGAVPTIGNRVYFGYPTGATGDGAFVTMSRVGGGPTPGATDPDDNPLLSFSVWAAQKHTASDAALDLVNALRRLDNEDVNGVHVYGTVTVTVVWLPDPSGQARYVVDARLHTRGATV